MSILMRFWSPSSKLNLDKKTVRFENILDGFENLKEVNILIFQRKRKGKRKNKIWNVIKKNWCYI